MTHASVFNGPHEVRITAEMGGRVLVALRNAIPGRAEATSVLASELRAALDEVAPLGKYTRTTPDPDDMDGGVAAALIEKEAEQCDAAEAHPLTPDAITDEAMRRAVKAWEETGELRPAIFAAITAPARPEGAEEIEALLAGSWPIDREGLSAAADDLAMNGVRVVSEDGAR